MTDANAAPGAMPGARKEEFLASVREALGRPDAPPATPYPRLHESAADLERQAAELHRRLRENRPALLQRLAEMAGRGGWQVHRAAGVEDALDYVASVARRLAVTRVVRSGQPVFDAAPVDPLLQRLGATVTPIVHSADAPREMLREEMRQAGLGLTGADYAIAETGSLVILPRRGLSRLVSLVPPVHLALVRPEEVLESLDDLFLLRRLEHRQNGGDLGSYLNFITGPSRTADIEMTIVQGVHGPREVHMVLLESGG